MVAYDPADLARVNRTARSAGAVGPGAVVPGIVCRTWYGARPIPTVLDYGAGPEAVHSKMLRDCGLDVAAWDIGYNFREGVHDPQALSRTYDVVMASNVLNVQPTPEHLLAVLDELFGLVKPYGMLVCNYPASPRVLKHVTFKDIGRMLGQRCCYVVHAGRTAWICCTRPPEREGEE